MAKLSSSPKRSRRNCQRPSSKAPVWWPCPVSSTVTPIWPPPCCGALPTTCPAKRHWRPCFRRRTRWIPAVPRPRRCCPSRSACASASPPYRTSTTIRVPPPRPWRNPELRPIWPCPATALLTPMRNLILIPTSSAGSCKSWFPSGTALIMAASASMRASTRNIPATTGCGKHWQAMPVSRTWACSSTWPKAGRKWIPAWTAPA